VSVDQPTVEVGKSTVGGEAGASAAKFATPYPALWVLGVAGRLGAHASDAGQISR
jgi:hypothetical protein